MARRTPREYIDDAKQQILDLLEIEKAVTARELEARISEPTDIPTFGVATNQVDPHHVATARKELLLSGQIETSTGRTRGRSREITVFHLPIVRGNRTAINAAAGRKRLLTARHEGLSRVSDRHPKGLIGTAGEIVVATALSDINGYVPYQSGPGETTELLGVDLNNHGGPIDNSAALVDYSAALPKTYTVGIEVKNRREWFGPANERLHHFLYKMAIVQQTEPDQPLVPVFICRRREHRTFAMAKQLGFYVIQYRSQFVRPVSEVNKVHFEEIRQELGYTDLELSETPNNALLRALENLPKYADDLAELWRSTGSTLDHHYGQLRQSNPTTPRRDLLIELKSDLRASGTNVAGW